MNIQSLAQLATKNKKHIIGLMFGTSLDGVDTVLLAVKGNETQTKVEQIKFITYLFPKVTGASRQTILGKICLQ